MTSKIKSMFSRLAAQCLKPAFAIFAACIIGGAWGETDANWVQWRDGFEVTSSYYQTASELMAEYWLPGEIDDSAASGTTASTSAPVASQEVRLLADGSVSRYLSLIVNSSANNRGGHGGTTFQLPSISGDYSFEFDWYARAPYTATSGTGEYTGTKGSFVVVKGGDSDLVMLSTCNNNGTTGYAHKFVSGEKIQIASFTIDGRGAQKERSSGTSDNWFHISIESDSTTDKTYIQITRKDGTEILAKTEIADSFISPSYIYAFLGAGNGLNEIGLDNFVIKTVPALNAAAAPSISMTDSSATSRSVTLTHPDGIDIFYWTIVDGVASEVTKYIEPVVFTKSGYVYAYAKESSGVASETVEDYIVAGTGTIQMSAPTAIRRRGLTQLFVQAPQSSVVGHPEPVITAKIGERIFPATAHGSPAYIDFGYVLDYGTEVKVYVTNSDYLDSPEVTYTSPSVPTGDDYAVRFEVDYASAIQAGGAEAICATTDNAKTSDVTGSDMTYCSMYGNGKDFSGGVIYYDNGNRAYYKVNSEGFCKVNREMTVLLAGLSASDLLYVNYGDGEPNKLSNLSDVTGDYQSNPNEKVYKITADGDASFHVDALNNYRRQLYGIRVCTRSIFKVGGVGYYNLDAAVAAADEKNVNVITVADTSVISEAPEGWSFYDSVTLKRNPVVIFEDTGTGGSLVVSANGEGIASGAKVGFGTEIAATVTRTANYRSATVTLVDGSAIEHSETTTGASATVNYTIVADDLGKTITISTSGVLKEYRTLSESFDSGVASVAYRYNNDAKTLAQINSLFDYGGAGESAKSRSVEATITPASGYRVAAATVNSEAIDVNDNNVCTVTWAANVKDITFAVSTVPIVTVTIPSVANATAAVTVGGVPQVVNDSACVVDVGAEVSVTYTADDGYYISAGSASQTFTATSENAGTAVTAPTSTYIMAMVGTTPYATMTAAASAASAGGTIRVVGDYTSGNLSFGPVFAGKTIEFNKLLAPTDWIWTGTGSSEYDENWLTWKSVDGTTSYGIKQGNDAGNLSLANSSNQKARLNIKSGYYHAGNDVNVATADSAAAWLTIDGGRIESRYWTTIGGGKNSQAVVNVNDGQFFIGSDGTTEDGTSRARIAPGEKSIVSFTQLNGATKAWEFFLAEGSASTVDMSLIGGILYAHGNIEAAMGASSTNFLTVSGAYVEALGEVWLGVGDGSVSTNYVTSGAIVNHNWFCVGRGNGIDAYLEVNGGAVSNLVNSTGCNFTIGTCGNSNSRAAMVVKNGEVYAENNIYIGEFDTAVATISGGKVSALGNVTLGVTDNFVAGETASLNLDGGVITTRQIVKGSGVGSTYVNFNGGTLKTLEANVNLIGTGFTAVNISGAGGMIIDSDYAVTIPANVTKGDGDFTPAITKKGSGALTFTGTLPSGTVITVQKNGGIVIVSKSADIALGDCTVVASETDTTKTLEYSAPSVTVAGVTATYGVDFTNATVTATLTGATAGQSYTMTVGGKSYNGEATGGGTVTFNDVAVTYSTAYDTFTYEITSNDASVADGSGTKTIADEAAWFQSNSTTTEGGEWENALSWSEGKATVGDGNQFTPVASDASVVDVTLQVCFGDANNGEIDLTGASAAVKIATVKVGDVDTLVFQALNNGTFVTLTGVTPDAATTYNVALHLDYAARKYTVKIGDTMMQYNDSELLAMPDTATAMSAVAFAGQGTLTSLVGETSEGYVAMDAEGNRYVSLDAAMAAGNENPTKLPLTVLHDGTFNNETYAKSSQVLPAGVNNVTINAVDQAAANAAAANMEIALTSAQVTQGLKKDYYKAVATKGEGNSYSLSIELDETEVAPTVAADADHKAMEVTASGVKLNVTDAKAGLYYGIAASDSADVSGSASSMTKCESDGVLDLPAIALPENGVKYYKVIVDDSPTPTLNSN